jgi:hypothetical protein
MSAAAALNQARAAGVAVVLDDENLMLTAPAPPPASVITALGRHKSEVLALLRPGTCGWSADDWHAFFEKGAGVAALEARLPREEAEARAFACCVAEWLNRKLVQSPPGRCLGCGGSEHPQDKLLPFGTDETGQAWLNSRCWHDWHTSRKAEAVATLSTFAICMRTSR